jgi:hypothetical protein
MKYELDFYIPKDGIGHSHRREDLKSFMESSSGISYVEHAAVEGHFPFSL